MFIGGPGTGKTSVFNALISKGFYGKAEVSRAVTLEAKEKGIDQLFLTDPILFSELLLKSREQQFLDAEKSGKKIVFFDRGVPDVEAYLKYFKTSYPPIFSKKSRQYTYSKIFSFAPWKAIYTKDNERYENFEEAVLIHQSIENTYKELGYTLEKVPFCSVQERVHFILNALSLPV